jgi:Zn-dependent protease
MSTHVQVIVLSVFVLLYSAVLHEIAHAWVAWRLGDPTAKMAGRITLNPLPHIDPFFTILLPIVTAFAGTPFGGARPVPIDPMNFRVPSKGLAISSAAGPVTNLLLAAAGFLVTAIAGRIRFDLLVDPSLQVVTLSGLFLFLVMYVNLLLGFFNLIPIPPLDGSRMLRYFLPFAGRNFLDRLEGAGLLLLMALLWLTPLPRFLFYVMFLVLVPALAVGLGPEGAAQYLGACGAALGAR